jgi:Na+-transporting methylmalonyl-CoA/oxaloacetate decarboxylase gamma subunit
MAEELIEGLEIVGVGIGGVFVNLALLALAIVVIGRVFGKKKKPVAKPAPTPP